MAALRKDAPVHRQPQVEEIREVVGSPTYQAFWILRAGFTIAPIVMGADKFLGILQANWTQYLWPGIPQLTGIPAQTFMYGVGAIEIVAGVLVALWPRWFAWLVAAWLGGIILNLVLLGDHYDIAMRDVGLMIGAIALARIAQGVHQARRT